LLFFLEKAAKFGGFFLAYSAAFWAEKPASSIKMLRFFDGLLLVGGVGVPQRERACA
jgi:hypothetical protein